MLDVGAGTGWLVDHALDRGATAVGIEPSSTNVAIGKDAYPRARLLQATLDSFQPEPDAQFDTVASVMAVGHMPDIDAAFGRMEGLLRPARGSEIVLVVPDPDYFTRPRNGYKDVVVFDRGDGESIQGSVKNDGSVLADIIRKPRRYMTAAANVGLHTTHDIPMPPTEGYMAAVPRYRGNRDVPMTRLMRFAR